jgi:hypothetical protein
VVRPNSDATTAPPARCSRTGRGSASL